MQFRLLEGFHRENHKNYKKGDSVESPYNLDEVFPARFERIDIEPIEGEIPPEIPTKDEVLNEFAAKETLKTHLFPQAALFNLKVIKKLGKYKITDINDVEVVSNLTKKQTLEYFKKLVEDKNAEVGNTTNME